MAIYGYARVSTTDQGLTVQIDALKAAGCTVIRAEKVTGTTTAGRDELATLLDFVREGDVLMVAHRSPGEECGGPTGHREALAKQGRIPQGHRATDRHEHASR
jgi:hypothetical protein